MSRLIVSSILGIVLFSPHVFADSSLGDSGNATSPPANNRVDSPKLSSKPPKTDPQKKSKSSNKATNQYSQSKNSKKRGRKKKPQFSPALTARSNYYSNCSEARAAGVTPLHRGDIGYRAGLDRDGDGIACE